jgi:RND superfamily putative drug exporter
MERIAAWSARHKVTAIGGWLALAVLAVVVGGLLGGGSLSTSDPGEAGRAERILDAQPVWVPTQENILVTGPDRGAAAQDLLASLPATGAVAVRTAVPGLVTFQFAGPDPDYARKYDAAVAAVQAVRERHPGARLDQAGDRSLSLAVDDSLKADFHRTEQLSLPLTLVILVLVFGSLIAAGLPLLLAGTAVAATFGLLQLLDNVVPVNSASSAMILLIGMAVGVDYSLFALRRYREERLADRDVPTALRITARTSGRVILVSGVTVILCLSGLLFTGLDVFRGLTLGAALVVGLSVLGSVTVLPALLSALGPWVDRARVPWLGRRRTTARESRFWATVAGTVVRRPALWGGLAALLLVLLAVPALRLHPQDAARTESLPRSVPTVDSALRMQAVYPGASAPAWVTVWRPDGAPVDVGAAVAGLHAAAGGSIREPITVDVVGTATLIRVPLAGKGTDPVSYRALTDLRERILPATVGRLAGVDFAVGGRTAIAHDFAAQLSARALWVVALVVLLALVLLVVAFRNVLLALASILLNLLSIAAALGVLTWVFQDGHFERALGFTSYGGVVGWLPLFMFVMLLGLSMDYHIFILSRIRERGSIVAGTATSAGVVTSAAVIMVAVFGVFVTLSAIEYKMLGIGMAMAILIDATLVRGVLLPAALALLGRRALPRVTAADASAGSAPSLPVRS